MLTARFYFAELREGELDAARALSAAVAENSPEASELAGDNDRAAGMDEAEAEDSDDDADTGAAGDDADKEPQDLESAASRPMDQIDANEFSTLVARFPPDYYPNHWLVWELFGPHEPIVYHAEMFRLPGSGFRYSAEISLMNCRH